MPFVRLLVCLVAAACLGGFAGSASSATGAPTGLHAFLLRADEPPQTTFSRTPSFAWNPVSGADHYEFQLSLSNAFRDNAVVWADLDLRNPVDAPPIALPWISGDPHSLYARVRAVVDGVATPWSAPYGFDMAPPPPPTPLPSYPGLLRWTPVPGAVRYEVWLLDADNKHVFTTTNVLDEREFYAFHQTLSWMGTIHWRIRAYRADPMADQGINKLPATSWGAWSPVYVSTNPAFAGGPIKLVGTVSDVFSDGSPSSPAHRLMPAFLWTGNETANGTTAELFRVYVFSDRQCLNPVYASPAVASPAYAPRPFGSIAMPATASGIQEARTSFLGNGSEPAASTYAGDPIAVNEFQPAANPTTTAPGAPGATGGATSSGSTGSGGGGLAFPDKIGAPIDIWDTDWPRSGYYWTVIPVGVQAPDQLSTGLTATALAGSATLTVGSTDGFRIGDVVSLGAAPNIDTSSVTAVGPTTLTLSTKLLSAHFPGETVTRSNGALQYRDLEMAQDVCGSGRVMRFGKDSEPSLTASNELFATGLSSDGRLTSARHTTQFYGQPLVSWTPALGAWAYEVQWSKTNKPFTPLGSTMTKSTSYVLPLTTGSWYYRVRGFDYSLPTGSQQMSWSVPARLVVAAPTFKVVSVGKAPTLRKVPTRTATPSTLRRVAGDGFSMTVPASWKRFTVKDSVVTFAYGHTGASGLRDASVNVLRASGRNGRSFAQWASDLTATYRNAKVKYSTSVVTLGAGKAVRIATTLGGFSLTQYAVDAGSTAYLVTLAAKTSARAAYASTLAKEIASFRIG